MNRLVVLLVGTLLCSQSFAMSIDPLDTRLNKNKPTSPVAAKRFVDENGNFIPISMTDSDLMGPDKSKSLCDQDKDFREFMKVLPRTGCDNVIIRKQALEAWIIQLPSIAKVTCGGDDAEFLGLLDMALYEYERISESCGR